MSTAETLVGQCERCGGALEFKVGQIGQIVRCYHCGLETPLYPSVNYDPETIVCRSTGIQAKRVNAILVGIAVVAVVWNVLFLACILFPGLEEKLGQILNRVFSWR